MSIISVKDNKNNRRKRNAKIRPKKSRARGTEAIVKVWQINDFAERLSKVFSN